MTKSALKYYAVLMLFLAANKTFAQTDSALAQRTEVKQEMVEMREKLNKFLGDNPSPEIMAAVESAVSKKLNGYVESFTAKHNAQQQEIDDLKMRLAAAEEKIKQLSEKPKEAILERKLDVLYFDVGSYTLSNENKAIIRKIGQQHADKTLQIVAYTDWVGDDTYNQKLSNDRAAVVQKEFLSNGFPSTKIEIYSKGKMVNKQDNLPAQECRRVEIRY